MKSLDFSFFLKKKERKQYRRLGFIIDKPTVSVLILG